MSSPAPLTPLPTEGRLAGIDFGTVRIGVAVTDRRQTLASPLDNYTRRDPASDLKYFQQMAEQERLVAWVVGLPVHGDGNESNLSIAARKFGESLAQATSLPVVYYDERFTSVEAEQWLGTAKLTSKQRKQRRDMLAAQIMLSAFLESRAKGADKPQPLDDRDR
ncbi:MAG: Holliday junction resolvase RuvX [Planctomycetes bacterium]|nr:Holliday junction resolvase RuvX [Planctomycetota bacterium]